MSTIAEHTHTPTRLDIEITKVRLPLHLTIAIYAALTFSVLTFILLAVDTAYVVHFIHGVQHVVDTFFSQLANPVE